MQNLVACPLGQCIILISRCRIRFLGGVDGEASCTAKWMLLIQRNDDNKQFIQLWRGVLVPELEEHSSRLELPDLARDGQINMVELYLEGEPATADLVVGRVELRREEQSRDWREEADRRIESIRKGEVTVKVVADTSVDLSNIQLEVEQVSHSFSFGTAANGGLLAECHQSGQDSPYCAFIGQNFNSLVLDYHMKWKYMEPSQGELRTEVPDLAMAWARAHTNISLVRGHALLWPKQGNNPQWVRGLQGRGMEEVVMERIDFATQR